MSALVPVYVHPPLPHLCLGRGVHDVMPPSVCAEEALVEIYETSMRVCCCKRKFGVSFH